MSTFDQRELRKINYFDENVYSVRERVKKCPFSHTAHIFVKIIYYFKFTLIKSTQNNNYNFRLQGLQIEAFQQRYLKCKCETPYLEGELVPKTCKN